MSSFAVTAACIFFLLDSFSGCQAVKLEAPWVEGRDFPSFSLWNFSVSEERGCPVMFARKRIPARSVTIPMLPFSQSQSGALANARSRCLCPCRFSAACQLVRWLFYDRLALLFSQNALFFQTYVSPGMLDSSQAFHAPADAPPELTTSQGQPSR